jgi:hypothetical protein
MMVVKAGNQTEEDEMTLGKRVDAFQKHIAGDDTNAWSELNVCNSTSLIDGSGCLQQTVLREEEDGTRTVLGSKVYSVRVVDEWVES